METDEQFELRDWTANETIIDGSGSGSTVSINAVAYIDGFTITGGFSDFGGGLNITSASATITNSRLFGNYTQGDEIGGIGGGAFIKDSRARISHCQFSNNTTFGDNGSGAGGGLYIEDSTVTIGKCTVCSNVSGDGAGITFWESNFRLSDSLITNNVGQVRNPHSLPGIRAQGGGALISGSTGTITNCMFYNNRSTYGDQVETVYIVEIEMLNCTVYSSLGGPLLTWIRTPPILDNTIVWGGGLGGADATVTYSNIQGGYPGEGNISEDPLFVDPENGDLRLLPGSPCIDTAGTTGPPTDIEGNPRPYDVPGIGRDGTGDEFDMGAYEYIPEPTPTPTMVNERSDIDQSGKVDAADLLHLLCDWQKRAQDG